MVMRAGPLPPGLEAPPQADAPRPRPSRSNARRSSFMVGDSAEDVSGERAGERNATDVSSTTRVPRSGLPIGAVGLILLSCASYRAGFSAPEGPGRPGSVRFEMRRRAGSAQGGTGGRG